MKVLDVGSGAGDVALLLADLVGPSSSVIGVEMNPTILETASARVRTAGWTNVILLQGDIRSITLGNDFDAVVGRWVLMHSSDPVAVLHHLVSYLRPGGIIAFQESDFTYLPMAFPSGPLHQQVIKWTTSAPEHGTPDLQMGLHLYQTYLDAGLPAPQLRLEAPTTWSRAVAHCHWCLDALQTKGLIYLKRGRSLAFNPSVLIKMVSQLKSFVMAGEKL